MQSRALQLQRWISRYACREIMPLRQDTGVISFCFDDAPKSACHIGRKLLEHYGCHGTWYIAGGLTDQLEMGRPCHSVSDVQSLAASGHHIGCHTFSHRPCDQLSTIEMVGEITRNAAFFDRIGVPSSKLHFSFPLGAFDLASKRLAAQCFVSTRMTSGGAHFGSADLHALRAEKLYQHLMTRARLVSLAKEVAEKKGWLILYTHDVSESPSEWGCTPDLLRCAIETALEMGCRVLPVNQAIRYWADGP